MNRYEDLQDRAEKCRTAAYNVMRNGSDHAFAHVWMGHYVALKFKADSLTKLEAMEEV